ncbi:MAG TPA: hypothetical protein DEP51_07365 [Clostridiales bacterium]|nr:hypothetical protein [Clostridiales bacterium]
MWKIFKNICIELVCSILLIVLAYYSFMLCLDLYDSSATTTSYSGIISANGYIANPILAILSMTLLLISRVIICIVFRIITNFFKINKKLNAIILEILNFLFGVYIFLLFFWNNYEFSNVILSFATKVLWFVIFFLPILEPFLYNKIEKYYLKLKSNK